MNKKTNSCNSIAMVDKCPCTRKSLILWETFSSPPLLLFQKPSSKYSKTGIEAPHNNCNDLMLLLLSVFFAPA